MQRISSWTDLVAALGLFRYGTVTGGVAPTPLKAEWLNMVQEELANAILHYLPALDANDPTQLLQAIQASGGDYALKATTLAGYGILNAYTKPETDGLLAGKANWGITLAAYGIGDAYTKIATDGLLAGKANNATTLGGYGITDAYTQVATNGLLAGKANNATSLAGYGITDPVWTDWNATPKAIVAQASAEAGGVGTYALLMVGGSASSSYEPLYQGALVAGSACLFTNAGGASSSGTPAGTWKLMGTLYNHDAINPDSATLCLRVS
ncbi:hypothetical protein [Pseudomonas fluorescens]|uniref:Tail fiber protein n=1 Tax=Pseudomonas fluorescens TaxID=294 RepID=A0A5E7RX29_PSEFL|nr:hypothetical protein [Pseudomonas fluorescens]VVP78414.1 hypothetical protein PS928_00478 [Pseudomonas fluorescens]